MMMYLRVIIGRWCYTFSWLILERHCNL